MITHPRNQSLNPQAEQDMEELTENAEDVATEEVPVKEEENKGGRLHYRVRGFEIGYGEFTAS